MASYADLAGTAPAKLTKSRSKPVVKPILKKKGTQSAKSSLDLDRSWEEQIHYGSHGWGAGAGGGNGKGPKAPEAGTVGWDDGEKEVSIYGGGRDVSFSLANTDYDLDGSNSNIRSKYSHARSTSGASHASIATSGSGPGSYRNGSTFVHPFQQTPRTATPPLSYANSLASFDQPTANSRDYSPTITEDEDLELDGAFSFHVHSRNNSYQGSATAHSLPAQNILASHSSGNNSSGINLSNSASINAPRRPSLASNRTSSFSDVNAPQAQRVNTNRSTSISGGSRLAHVASTSDLNLVTESNESPSSSSAAFASTPGTTAPISSSFSLSSPISPSAMSPLRTSLEGFRLRSRSDLDTGANSSYNYHAERIRQERQKWQEKERAKELKREKDDLKKRDRAGSKELHRLEREQAQIMKEAEALVKKEQKEAARRRSSAEEEATGRPMNAGSPKFSAAYMSDEYPQKRRKRSKAEQERKRLETKLQKMNIPPSLDPNTAEKLAFASRNYESTDQGQAPTAAQSVSFDLPRRSTTAKRKTQGAWTSFMLWFRTRILRLQTKLEK